MLIIANTYTAKAQAPTFATLIIELWPEYDQSETLVIYRLELDTGTTLPAEVSFQLPDHINDLNAIAFEEGGQLFSLPEESIEQTHRDEALWLTITTNSPRIHLEYYDSEILTIEGDSRHLVFDFTAQHPIQSTTFRVQEPLQAEALTLSPLATSSFSDDHGLTYHTIPAAGLDPGATTRLEATYSRPTSIPSIQLIAPANAPPLSLPVSAQSNDTNTGYLLLGSGVLLLLVTGSYWWWSQRQKPAAHRPSRTPKQRRKQKVTPVSKQVDSQPRQAAFCTKCGTALRAESRFCHACGTERRNLT